jgi:hypothetical protein
LPSTDIDSEVWIKDARFHNNRISNMQCHHRIPCFNFLIIEWIMLLAKRGIE